MSGGNEKCGGFASIGAKAAVTIRPQAITQGCRRRVVVSGSRYQDDVSGNCSGRLPKPNGDRSVPMPNTAAATPSGPGKKQNLAGLRAEAGVAQEGRLAGRQGIEERRQPVRPDDVNRARPIGQIRNAVDGLIQHGCDPRDESVLTLTGIAPRVQLFPSWSGGARAREGTSAAIGGPDKPGHRRGGGSMAEFQSAAKMGLAADRQSAGFVTRPTVRPTK